MNDKNCIDESRNSRIVFSKRQNRIISNAVSLLAMSVLFVIVCLTLYYLFRFESAHSSVLLPPIVAIICAKVVQPAYDGMRKFFWKVIGRKFLRLNDHKWFIETDGETKKEKFARATANSLAIIVLAALVSYSGGKIAVSKAPSSNRHLEQRFGLALGVIIRENDSEKHDYKRC